MSACKACGRKESEHVKGTGFMVTNGGKWDGSICLSYCPGAPAPLTGAHDCNRCERCGWTYATDRSQGCAPGDCSMRPLPPLRTSCAGCGVKLADAGAANLSAKLADLTRERDALKAENEALTRRVERAKGLLAMTPSGSCEHCGGSGEDLTITSLRAERDAARQDAKSADGALAVACHELAERNTMLADVHAQYRRSGEFPLAAAIAQRLAAEAERDALADTLSKVVAARVCAEEERDAALDSYLARKLEVAEARAAAAQGRAMALAASRGAYEDLTELRTENERLREALKMIAWNDSLPPASSVLADVIRLRDIARKALSATGDEGEKAK